MNRFLFTVGIGIACLTSTCFGMSIPENANAVVSKHPIDTQLPVFKTISQAIDNIPSTRSGTKKWTIFITSDTYHERVVVPHNNLRLLGENRDTTVVIYSRYAGQAVAPNSRETWGTRRTATMELIGQNISIEHLTVKNGFDYPGNEAKGADDPTRVSGTQAVALKTDSQSDRTFLNNVALWSYQDTLYLKGDRTFIQGGIIAGNVDFIFGEGSALFDGVTLLSRERHLENDGYWGYITAPSTNIHRPYGLTFVNCRLEREPGVPDNSVALGRPWHPTTTFSDGRYADPAAVGKATYINTFMAGHIAKERWTSMNGKTPSGEKKAFSPHTEARFAEYGSYGEGAGNNALLLPAHPHQLSQKTVAFYTSQAILRGWLPEGASPTRFAISQ
ncbi:pectinesterase family protein [Alteromonas sp. D210916BOD_24]